LDNLFIPVKKTRIALYVFFLLCILATAVILQLHDTDPEPFWDIVTYICITLICYLIYIYGKDLLSKKAGLCIKKQGLHLNIEYYKDILVSWQDITAIQSNKYTLLLHVKDSEKYLSQIPKILAFFIKGNLKRFGTIFIIRCRQIDMEKDVLLEKLKQSMKKYKKGQ